jgi:glycosyltransferase involved in cell wall biosynthesis
MEVLERDLHIRERKVMTLRPYTILALGPASPPSDAEWMSHPFIKTVINHEAASVTGKRFGSRILGVGFDSLMLALRTLKPSVKGPYFTFNPWIGVALRLTGRKNFVVTGIYAEPPTRSWRVLRRFNGDARVITMCNSEIEPWNASGGRAHAVLYGNTFEYPPKKPSPNLHIFIGGTSDRDPGVIRMLEEEVLASSTPVRLTLATGGPASEIRNGENVVVRPGYVNQRQFGELLSTASVVFLPLAYGTRAAGHMVLVGALQCGIPVAVAPNEGMRDYVKISPAIVRCELDQPVLPQLQRLADATRGKEEEIRALWAETFSLTRYIARVEEILAPLASRSHSA